MLLTFIIIIACSIVYAIGYLQGRSLRLMDYEDRIEKITLTHEREINRLKIAAKEAINRTEPEIQRRVWDYLRGHKLNEESPELRMMKLSEKAENTIRHYNLQRNPNQGESDERSVARNPSSET